ncbi:MAG: phage holin family protein [Homoserinimonas sp.]
MTEPIRPKRSLLTLLTDLPGLVSELIAAEIEQLKAELTRKFTALGIGAGLLAGAAVVLLFMVGVLLTAAILALSLVMPGWLAALLVALVLLLIAALLGWIGYRKLQAGIPPLPTETINSLEKDLNVVRGVGK